MKKKRHVHLSDFAVQQKSAQCCESTITQYSKNTNSHCAASPSPAPPLLIPPGLLLPSLRCSGFHLPMCSLQLHPNPVCLPLHELILTHQAPASRSPCCLACFARSTVLGSEALGLGRGRAQRRRVAPQKDPTPLSLPMRKRKWGAASWAPSGLHALKPAFTLQQAGESGR